MTEQTTVIDTIEMPTVVLSRRSDGLVVLRVRDGARQTVADARQNVAALARMAEGEPRPCLLDMRAPNTTDRGVREYYASKEGAGPILAMAVLMPPSMMRVLGNLFLAFTAPIHPTKLFSDEDEAIAWLRKFVPRRSRAG